MIEKQQRKLKRMATLMTILSRHGFKDVWARMTGAEPKNEPENGASAPHPATVYARIRMVLEDLGPTFVKLGQAMSNREDVFPKDFIRELQNLQDHVKVDPMDIDSLLDESFGAEYRANFAHIEQKPLASASIAQVHKATLVTGEEVVLKIKRPKIDEAIEGDLLLMKDLAKGLTAYFDFAEHLNLEQTVSTFERTLLDELSFVHERENMERFAANFKDNPHIYVPKVFPYLSNNRVLCMEFVEGCKATDTAYIIQHGYDPAKLVDRGFELFLIQILEHGFFHADPHAGNILVRPDGRIVFIDMGAMGTIYPSDQEMLEDIVVSIMTQNANELVNIIKKMAIKVEIRNEAKLRADLAAIVSELKRANLENINITVMLQRFKDILYENRIMMPDYFTLLARGLMLIESVGRTVNPDMNVLKSVEPYVTRMLKKRLTPQYLMHRALHKMQDLTHDIQTVPVEMRDILHHLSEGSLLLRTQSQDLPKTNHIIKAGFQDIALAIVLGANIIATAMVLSSDKGPEILGIPLFGIFGVLASVALSGFLVLKMLRK